MRDRVLYGIGASRCCSSAASFAIGQITAGQDLKIIKDLGLATIEIAGALMTIFIGVGLVSREIDRRSIFSLLAKPLPRWEFVVGKYFGPGADGRRQHLGDDGRALLMLGWLDLVTPANVRLAWDAPAARSPDRRRRSC